MKIQLFRSRKIKPGRIERAHGSKPIPADGSGLKRFVRKAFRIAVLLAAVWSACVVVFSFLWWVAPPVSTLMLGRWLTFRTVERTAVDIESISPHLVSAVINSEDARFCGHWGIDWGSLQQVVTDEDGPSRGASTIAMQTAKNLFLWPSRSYLRKGLELPVAAYLNLVWSKRRMLEVYLNIAEWGDGIFGAEAASRKYFRKSAKQLTEREAALLATALPNPFRRNPGRPTSRHQALAANLMDRMAGAGPVADCVLD